jgi:hypothetical protein
MRTLALRAKVYMTRVILDRRIAAGEEWDTDAALALRASQLTEPRTQHAIARNLRGVVNYADRRRGSGRIITSVVIDPPAVRAGRRSVLELAEQLERAAPVDPRGILRARALLTDGISPLFNRYSGQTVAQATREVHETLEQQPASREFSPINIAPGVGIRRKRAI